MIKYALVLMVLKTVGCLSLANARRLGALIGWCAFKVNTRAVKVTRRNIDLCMPNLSEPEKADLVYRSVLETGVLAAETCVVWARDKQWLRQHVCRVEGDDKARAILKNGQGLLILAPHIGNWEIVGGYLALLGPTTNLYQPPKIAALEQLVQQSRAQYDVAVVPTNRRGLTKILKTLKEGGVSGILPDQNPREENAGRFAPFFGQPAFTMTFVSNLIRKTGCKAMFVYAKRVPEGFELVFQDAPEALYSDDEMESISALNEGVEACVRAIPEQYQWEYKRFKKQPPGAASVYQF